LEIEAVLLFYIEENCVKRKGFDIGGTFTDIVNIDDEARKAIVNSKLRIETCRAACS
jgi:hypothetical protein